MAFEFEAALVVPDVGQQSLSFADRQENHQHYLIIQRDQEAWNEVLPDVENVYIERDDQQFGGYGGIEAVIVNSHRLTLKLTPRMSKQMGHHNTLSVVFAEDAIRGVEQLITLIFRGYEPRVIRAGHGGSAAG